jgi:transposase InsO family protein
MKSIVKNLLCDSCLLHNAHAAPRNKATCTKPMSSLIHMSCDIWGHVNVPSPHGLRYCLLVIDHHTHYMWVRFLKSKDETCASLEAILLELKHTHAKHHAPSTVFAPIIKFDNDMVLESADTQRMCAQVGVGTQFSTPYAHHMLGKAEWPWRTLRGFASAMMHSMFVPPSMWSCAINTIVFLRNRTFNRFGHAGAYPSLFSQVSPQSVQRSVCSAALLCQDPCVVSNTL